MTGLTLQPRFVTHQPTDWSDRPTRRQPAFSVAMMLALLIGLAGVAHPGQARGDDSSPVVAGLVAQSSPVASPECVAYGPAPRTDDELSGMSISDWPVRHYTPVAVADPAVGEEAKQVYDNWQSCSSIEAPKGPSFITDPPAVFLSYFSDRMQYVHFLGRNPERAPDELVAANAFDQAELLTNGTLPLNRPLVLVMNDPEVGGGFYSFAPGDVYMLTDGRYGTIVGTLSTTELEWLYTGSWMDGAEATRPPILTWVAFVEVNGRLFIDEYVPFCLTPLADLQATPTVADPYAEADRLGNCRPIGT